MKKALSIMLAVALVAMVGCSKGPKKPADLPALNPTTITVTYDDGEAVADATVVLRLAQQGGGRTWNVVGQTDAKGVAVMKTDGNWDGVPAGDYQGMVTKEVSDIENPTEQGGSATVKSVTRYVATRYNDPHNSGLTATIQSGSNNIEFKVGEKIEEDVKML